MFGSLCIVYFSFIFFFRNRHTAKTRNIGERRKELTPVISNFLFYGDDASKEEKYEHVGLKVEMREFLKDPVNRSILKDILLDLQRDLTGDSRARLLALYKDFDLYLDSIAKLKSWRWEVVTKGIVELTQMQVEEAYTAIRRFINHRRNVIRRHAQIATVSLKHEGISHFLDSNKYPISEWQQIKILEVLREKEDFIPPNFGVWLMSSNKDVVLFALRLIRYYNQTDANPSVTQLLKHKDDEIKQAAIDCIKEFGITEAIPTLRAAFPRAKRDTRILILDAIGTIGSEEDIPFLREVHSKVSNFNVRSKALGAINTIAPGTVLPHENLDPLIDPDAEPRVEADHETLPDIHQSDTEPASETDETAEEEVEVIEGGSELFHEDLEVFDHCFMEELNEILDGMRWDEQDEEPGYLPLDFLPIVTEKPTEMDNKKTKKKLRKRLWQLKVAYEEVHPDAEFRKELEDVLSRVEVQDPYGNTEVEYLNFNFLPFVVDNEPSEEEEEQIQTQSEDIQTGGVSGAYPVPAIDSDDPGTPSSREDGSDVGVSLGYDACALVDWDEIHDDSTPASPDASPASISGDEPSPLEPETSGYSVFEELFGKCDEDSKLILLQEIPELGDERELTFLDTLRDNGNIKVRKKAAEVRIKLEMRLKKEAGQGLQRNSLVSWEGGSGQNDILSFDLEGRNKQG